MKDSNDVNLETCFLFTAVNIVSNRIHVKSARSFISSF